MNKFKGMLICTDLDGTLFKKDKSVSRENIEAIEYFKSEGGYFTFVTGRMPQYVHSAYDAVKPNAPIGCVNGGAVYDMERERYLWRLEIERDALDMIDFADSRIEGLGIQVDSFDDIYFYRENHAMQIFRDLTGTPNLTINSPYEVTEPIGKILFGDTVPEKLDRLSEVLKEHEYYDRFDYIRSAKSLYEILPKGVSKGTLLVKIAEILGVDMQNTVAVGDYNNDIAMIKAAGVGYAVSNAVEEVKNAADRITVSNEEHAIAAIIRDIA